MTKDLDVFTSSDIISAVRLLISSVNVCRSDTIQAAYDTVRDDANSEYYDEQEILHKIADFIESKLK
jgi:hypothetical protein